MKVRFFSCLLVGLSLLSHYGKGVSFARPIVYTSMMIQHDEAMNGLHDFVRFLSDAGLRTAALEDTLQHLVLHEEGAQAAGVFLANMDTGLTITSVYAHYRNFLIVTTDAKTHIILKETTIAALVRRDFATADNPNGPLAAAINELLYAVIFHSHCFRGTVSREKALVNALAGHIEEKVAVGSLSQMIQEPEARQLQSDLTLTVSKTLAENPRWEQCYAALGHLSTDVDFDLMPSGEPIVEGTSIETQYITKGVVFSIADTLLPPDRLIVDDASAEINKFYRGISPSNVLTNRGFSPGPAGSLGCESDMKVNFLDPITQQPTTVRSASLRWIAGLVSPGVLPLPVQLIAKDRQGRVVASDTFQLQAFFFAPASFTLSVSSERKRIASIETQGVTGNGVCVAFDNLAFWPPIQ